MHEHAQHALCFPDSDCFELTIIFSRYQAAVSHRRARFPELDQMLAVLPQDGPLRWTREALTETNHPSSTEEELIGRQLSVSAQDFEFVPLAQPLTLSRVSSQERCRSYTRLSGFCRQKVEGVSWMGWDTPGLLGSFRTGTKRV